MYCPSSTVTLRTFIFGRLFSKVEIKGSYNMQIKEASLDMAGKYGCGTEEMLVQGYAYLVVAGEYVKQIIFRLPNLVNSDEPS